MMLQNRIRSTIPLSQAMQFGIRELSLDAIVVSAPLEPNVNIHGTGFAGSIYSVAVLTGWALCTHIMDELGLDGELVVGKAEIRYRRPIEADFHCRASVSADDRKAFVRDFQTRGKGKLHLQVEAGDEQNAILLGTYVAIARS